MKKNKIKTRLIRVSFCSLIVLFFANSTISAQISQEFFRANLFQTSTKELETRKYYDNTALHKVKKIDIYEKEVVVMLVKYYGIDQYFDETKKYIDSLRGLNYKIVYGGDSILGYDKKNITDTNDRKIRKCFCQYENPFQYLQKNKIHQYLVEKNKFTFYSKELFGIQENDLSLDISKNDFVKRIEAKKGEISLNKKDNKSGKYKCEEKNKKLDLYPIITQHILERIYEIDARKIVLVLDDRLWFSFFIYGKKQKNMKVKQGFIYEYYFRNNEQKE